jgi:hypothetical protein
MKQFGSNRIHEGFEPAVGGYQCNFWVPASKAERPALLSKIRSFLKDIKVNDNECELDWYDDSYGMSTGPQESYHINESINVLGARMRENTPLAMRHEFPGCHDINSVSGSLPPDIDSFLQDMAQITQCINYKDISNFGKRATKEDVKALRQICNEVEEDAEYGDDPSNYAQARVAAIVKGL